MVFRQVKNTMKFVNITRCDLKICGCMEYLLKDNGKINPPISRSEYNAYVKCYKENTETSGKKDVFLL